MQNSNAPQGPNKNQMHPEDMRNMFIFFILAALVYFSFDTLILKPQRQALQEQQKIEAEIQEALGPAATEKQIIEPKDRGEIITAAARVNFANNELNGSINVTGGGIDDAALKNYFETLDKKNNVTILNPRETIAPRGVEYGWVAKDKTPVPNKNTRWQIAGNTELSPDNPVTLVWNNGQGLTFERVLQIDEKFMFTITQRVINNGPASVTLFPFGLISQKGLRPDFQGAWVSYEGPVGFIGEELFNEGYKHLRKNKKEVFNADQGWLGFTDKYWLTALIPPQDQNVKYSYSYAGPEKDKENQGLYQVDFLGAAQEIAPGSATEIQSRLFVGAKKVLDLKAYEKDLEIPQFDLAVDFGWFWFMTKPFFYALHYLGLWIGNLGAAIIVITIILRASVFPLTNTSYKSFANMKKISPIISQLREKYGDDKQKLQQEMVEIYQREGVNPLSGCLPLLLQIPIFFALYKTFFVTIELRHAPFFGWIQDLSAPDPTTVFNLFGLIDWQPPGFLMIGVWPCLMLLIMIVQRKLNPPPQDPLQRDMVNYMPFLFAYIMSQFAAGLVVYWTFSALIGVIQQMIIMKSLGVPIHLFGETDEEEELEEAVDDGPAVHPMTEMAKQEAEEALGLKEKKDIKPPKPKKSKKKK